MFTFIDSLPPASRKLLLASEEAAFYEHVFCKIDERLFAGLYSSTNRSRPNAPVNVMVGALLLMQLKNWTYQELFANIGLNLATRYALGLRDFADQPMCPATLFNFQRKVREDAAETGAHKFEEVFDRLTAFYLERTGIDTSVQRGDSTMVGSNIRAYGRIELLVEVIRRMYRVLSEEDQNLYQERFNPYTQGETGEFCYRLRPSDVQGTLADLGEFYMWMVDTLEAEYGHAEIYRIVCRVFAEHFALYDKITVVREREELSSSNLQSPDDAEATYREKGKKKSRGYSVHVSETCHPENKANLVTDVAVVTNNTDDGKILEGRLEKMQEKTPELKEYHTDAAYGNEENDRWMDEAGITHIQTAIRGRLAEMPMDVEAVGEDVYAVTCSAGHTERSTPAGQGFKVIFSHTVCASCPLQARCPARRRTDGSRSYHFNREVYLRQRRHRALEHLPEERKKLRPNVEATVREFKHPMRNEKVRVRGLVAVSQTMFAKALMINFKRFRRYLREMALENLSKLSPRAACRIAHAILHHLNILLKRKYARYLYSAKRYRPMCYL